MNIFQLNTVRDSLGAVYDLKYKNGYLVSLSTDMNLREYKFCATIRQMSSPQNISEGTRVTLNRYCYGIDFNEKYVVVPVEGASEEDECDIQLFSPSTLEVVRTLKGCFHVRLLRNFVISELHDGTIRHVCCCFS